MIFYQRIALILITLAWCWVKASQYNDSSIWVFGLMAGLIEWLAYEGGKEMGVFMVVTLPAYARDRIIAEYNASQQQDQDDNTDDSNHDSNQGDSK